MLFPTTDGKGSRVPPRVRRWFLALLAVGLFAHPALAQWRLEGTLGDAWSLPSQVTFAQIGQPDIAETANWSTKPFRSTIYYGGRLVHWSGATGWGFEYTHHKLYLDNPVPGVDYFRITNGVNLFVPERLWRIHSWELAAGGGPVFVVPVSSVRGAVYNHAHGVFGSQYDLGGAVAQAGIARRIRVISFLAGVASLKVTTAYLHVKIANGHAETWNFALHAEYGVSLGK